MPSIKRPIRIAGSSGGFSDRQRAIGDLARSCDIDCIIGDWLSECTMTLHGAQKQENERLRKAGKLAQEPVGLFDPTFMENLSPALPYLRSKNIKVAVNAGASDTELLAGVVEAEVGKQGLDLKVGWINGDEVTETVRRMWQDGETFTSLMTGKPLQDWGHMDEFVAAQSVSLCVTYQTSLTGNVDAISGAQASPRLSVRAAISSLLAAWPTLPQRSGPLCGGTAGTVSAISTRSPVPSCVVISSNALHTSQAATTLASSS